MKSVFKNFMDVASKKRPDDVPTAFWGVSTWYFKILGYDAFDYYREKETKLKTMMLLQDDFEEAMLIPGIWPDFGLIAEASGFGGEIICSKSDPPLYKTCTHSYRRG